MNRPFDAASATSDNRITLSPEDELAVLRARVDELERESAERKRMDHALKALAFGTATATGQECLQQLVRQLSASLEVPCVFVTEFVPGSTDRVRTVAGWCQGKAADSVEYALQNSPCENVFRDGLVFLPRHVRQHFPQDEYLIALNIESYMGVPLLNGAGRATGHLCVMDVRPFGFDRGQGAAILSAFAERAAAELERLRAEETLKQSEERFRALYENNPTMYFTLTPDGTILSVNRFGAEELGYGSEELAGRSVLQVFQPADHHTVLNQLTLCAQNPGRTFDWEVQKVRKTGTLLWVKERARAIIGPDRTPIILIVCEDITEQRDAQDRIRDRERQLQTTTQFLHTLVRESPLPIVSLDADARVTSWNQAATKLFGWTERDVLGKELPYVPAGHEAEADALWNERARTSLRGPIPLRRQRKDGKLLDLLLWPVFVEDSTGELTTAVGLYVDQSELRQAEAARLHSEERLRSFLNALDDLAFELDAQGTYLNVWTRNEDTLLLPKQDLIGKSLTDIHGQEEGARHRDALARVLRSGQPHTIEYVLTIRGQLRHFSAVLSRIPASADSPATAACVVRETTAKKRAAEALRLSEQHLKSIIETSPECVKLVDADGILLQINAAGLAMIEADNAHDVLGQCVYPIVTESHRDAFRAMNERVCRGQKESLEFEIVGLRGSRRWMETHAVPLPNPADGTMVQLAITRDITDRKRAELALRESEQAIRAMQEATSAAGLTFDQRVDSVLSLGCRLFGLPIGLMTKVEGDQLVITHVWDPGKRFAPGMHLPLCQSYCGTTLTEIQPVAINHASRSEWHTHPGYRTLGLESYLGARLIGEHRAFGTICFLDQVAHPAPFTQAEQDFLLLMARWVSGEMERRSSEQALRLSEERFQIAFRSSPHPVVITELATGRCIEVNDTALQIFGFQRHEAVGHTTIAIELWPKPEDRTRFITKLLESGTLRSVEFTFQTKDHRLRHCLISSELIELNGTQCILTVGTDVTEKKAAEAALRESEERWQRFVADAPIGLVVVDADKHILSANKAFCTLTGYSEQEVINNTYALYTHPDDLPKNLELTDEFFAGRRQEYTYEKRYVRKDGEIIWVSIRASRLAVHGHATPLLLAVVEDITDRKQALADRERISQDLHDNILQSLYAVGMQLEAGKLLSGKAPRKSKQHVTQAIRQLNHLVLEVRQFIVGLTRRAAPSLDFAVAFKQLVASFSSDHHAAPALNIDPQVIAAITPAVGEQLLNITREALSNSVRHTTAAHRSVALTATDTHVSLRITDDGTGFDTSRKRRRGHGLANMAARARTIRAQFTLDSAPGQGTCITIDVPTGGPHVR
jgi:PAS domain S-box-containing protein